MKTSDIKTLDDLIRYSEVGNYTLPNISFIEQVDNLVVLDKLVYDDYRDRISQYIKQVKLTDEEYNNYKYRPEVLAYDLYGNQNLYHLLLFINNCSELEFDKYGVNIIPKEDLEEAIYKIISHEDDRLTNNRIY